MPPACRLSSTSSYAVKHNPWAYFSGSTQRAHCLRYDVPAGTSASGQLHSDVVYGHLPNVGLLVPNICHDAHNCSLRTADTWLRAWMRVIMAGPDYRSGHLAVVITFDEVEGTGTGTLLTTVVAPQLSHKTVTTTLNHDAWCRWMTDIVRARPLRSAATAP